MKYLILTLLFPPILTQFVADMGMKPDVTFGDHNDRFDMTSLVKEQPTYEVEIPMSDTESRRHSNKKIQQTAAENVKIDRGSEIPDDFAYHDTMDPSIGGSVEDFEENLKKFRADSRRYRSLVDHLHGKVRRRHNKVEGQNPEKEVLMHYAVPIDMTINGYLQVPLVD